MSISNILRSVLVGILALAARFIPCLSLFNHPQNQDPTVCVKRHSAIGARTVGWRKTMHE